MFSKCSVLFELSCNNFLFLEAWLVRDFYCRRFIKRIQAAWKQATIHTDALLNAALDGGERLASCSVIL